MTTKKVINIKIAQVTPGKVIAGYIKVSVQKAVAIKAVRLTLHGEGDFLWSYNVRKDSNESLEDENYKGAGSTPDKGAVELYLHKTVVIDRGQIVGSDNDERSVKKGPGLFMFPFSVICPANLPSSYKHDSNRVRIKYTAKVVVELHGEETMEFTKEFDLVALCYANQFPMALKPLKIETETFLGGCSWCQSEELYVEVSISKRGYVPGETVEITATVENKSKKGTLTVTAFIVQELVLNVTRVISSKNYSETHLGTILPKQTETLNGSCRIPSKAEPTNLGLRKSKHMELIYEVQITSSSSNSRSAVMQHLPIFIGTVTEPGKEDELELAHDEELIADITLKSD